MMIPRIRAVPIALLFLVWPMGSYAFPIAPVGCSTPSETRATTGT
jgi:hypothetical protein